MHIRSCACGLGLCLIIASVVIIVFFNNVWQFLSWQTFLIIPLRKVENRTRKKDVALPSCSFMLAILVWKKIIWALNKIYLSLITISFIIKAKLIAVNANFVVKQELETLDLCIFICLETCYTLYLCKLPHGLKAKILQFWFHGVFEEWTVFIWT